MIVITRNGQTTVLTGWRAWLAGAAAFLLTALGMAVVAFLLLGFAVTMTAVLLIVVPAAAIVVLLVSLFGRKS